MDSVELRQHLDDLANPSLPMPTAEQLQAAINAVYDLDGQIPEGRYNALNDRLDAAYNRYQRVSISPDAAVDDDGPDWADEFLGAL